MFQYTDGVTEAMSPEEELFGEDRLLETLGSAPSAVPAELLTFVHDQVDAFADGAPQFDDITMLALQYRGLTADSAEGLPDAGDRPSH